MKNKYGNKLNDLVKKIKFLLPGILLASFLSIFSILLGDLIGINILKFDSSPISPILLAIVFGILIRWIFRLPSIFLPGLRFSIKIILRIGIILLGIRLTLFDVLKLGAYGVPIVMLCIIGALIITNKINKLLDLPQRLGTLIAVGTSICGVSAIVATTPAIDANEEETSYAITVITIFGLFATLVYPHLANYIFNGNPIMSGLFLGTSVHETAQVIGAGKIFADFFQQNIALDVATVTKLVRNVFMVAVIPFMAFYYSNLNKSIDKKSNITNIFKIFPIFIIGFILMSIVRTIGDVGIGSSGEAFGIFQKANWTEIIFVMNKWAGYFLLIALASVGLNTDISKFKALGLKPFLVGFTAAVSVGLISYVAILLLGSFIKF